jgi:hypothetical protein
LDVTEANMREIMKINLDHIRMGSINTLIDLGHGLIGIPINACATNGELEIWDCNKGNLVAKHSTADFTFVDGCIGKPIFMPGGKMFIFGNDINSNEPIKVCSFKQVPVLTHENKNVENFSYRK